jgi:sugar diacid utilization regulator
MPSVLRLEEDNKIVKDMLQSYGPFQELDGLLVFEDIEVDVITALLEERVLLTALIDVPWSMVSLLQGLPYGVYTVAQAILWRYQKQSLAIKLPVDDVDIQTIDRFLANHQNVQETADDLFVHRNTLQYRLDRFYQKTGLQVRRFEDAVAYYVVRHFCASCQ